MIKKDRYSGITNPSLLLDGLLNFLQSPFFQQENGNNNPDFSDSKAMKVNSFKFHESLLSSLYEKCYLIKHCYYSKGATVTKKYYLFYCLLQFACNCPTPQKERLSLF